MNANPQKRSLVLTTSYENTSSSSSSFQAVAFQNTKEVFIYETQAAPSTSSSNTSSSTVNNNNNRTNNNNNNSAFLIKQLSDGAKEIYASSLVTAFANRSPVFVVADLEEEENNTTSVTTIDDEIAVRANNNNTNNVPFLTFFDATTGEPTMQQEEGEESKESSVVFLDELVLGVSSNQKCVDENSSSSSSLRISSLVFSSDDRFLYIAHEDFSLSVFDVESKTIVKRVEDRFCDLSSVESSSLDHQQTNLLLSPDSKGKILVIFNSSSCSLKLVATSGLTTPNSFPGSKIIKLVSEDNNDDETASPTIRVEDCCFSSDSLTLFVLVERQKKGQQDDDSDNLSKKSQEIRMFDTIRGNEIFCEGDETGRHRLFSSSSSTYLVEKKSRHFSCMKTSSSNGTLILLDEMNQELVLFFSTRNEQHHHVDPLTSTTTTLHSPSKRDFMIATSSSNENNNNNENESSISGAQRAAASLSGSSGGTIRTKNIDQPQPQQQQQSRKTTAPLEVVADVDALSTSSSSVYTNTLVSSPSFSYSTQQQNSTSSNNNNNNKKKGGISSSKNASGRQRFSPLNCRVVKMLPGNSGENNDDDGVPKSSSFDSFSFVPIDDDEKNDVMTILLTSSKTEKIKIIEINNKNTNDDKVDEESSVRGILEYQIIQKPNRKQKAHNDDETTGEPPLVVERDTTISHHFCSLTHKPNNHQNLLLLQHHHPLENCTRMTFFFFMSNFKRVIAGPLQVNNNNQDKQRKQQRTPPFYMSALNFVSTKNTFPPSLESLNVECYFYETTTAEIAEFPIDDIIIMMSTNDDENKNNNKQETEGELHHSSLHQNNSSSISPPPPRSLPRSVVETGSDPIHFYEDMKRNLLETESERRRVIENSNEFHLEHVFRFSFDRLQLENNEGLVRAFYREQQARISTDQKLNSIQTRESLLRNEIKCNEEEESVFLRDVNCQFKNVICVEAQQREKIRREQDESHQDFLNDEKRKNSFQNSSSQTEENSKQQEESDKVKNHVLVEDRETQVEQEEVEERQDEIAQNSNHHDDDTGITMLTNFSIRLLNDLESRNRQSTCDQQIECFNNEQKIFEQDRNRINTNDQRQKVLLLLQASNNETNNASKLRQLEKSSPSLHQDEITKMKMQLEEQDQRHACEQEKINEEREILQQQRISFMEHQQAFARKLEREKSERLEEIEALKQKLTKSESQLDNNRQESEKLRKDEAEKVVSEQKEKHEKEVELLKQQAAALKEENQKQHEEKVASEKSRQKQKHDLEDEKKKLISIHQNQLSTITSNFQSQISQMEKKNEELMQKIDSLQEQESKNEETVLQLQHDLDVKNDEIDNLKERNRKQRESFNLILEQLSVAGGSPSSSSSVAAAAEKEAEEESSSSSPHLNVSKKLRMPTHPSPSSASSPEIPFTNNNSKDNNDQNIANNSSSPAVRAASNITAASTADNFNHQHYSTATSTGTAAAQAILILQSQHELEKHEMEEEFANRLQEKDEALIATLDEITELRKEIEDLKNSSQLARTPTTKMSSSSPAPASFFVRNENDHDDDHSPLVSPSWKQKIQSNLPNSSSTSSPSRTSRSQKYQNHHNNTNGDVSLSPSSLTTTEDPYWRLQALQTFYKFDTQSLAAELYKTQTELATKSRQVDVANERLAIMIDELVVRENEAENKEKKLREKIQKLGGNTVSDVNAEEEEDTVRNSNDEKTVRQAAPSPIIHQPKNSHQLAPLEDEKLVDDMTHKELVEALKKPERKISEAILFGLDMDQEVDGYIFSHENFLKNFFESKDEASTLAASAPTDERQHFIQVRKEMLMRMRKERAKEEIEKRSKRNEEKEKQRKKGGLCF